MPVVGRPAATPELPQLRAVPLPIDRLYRVTDTLTPFNDPGTLDTHEPLVESTHMFLKSSAPWHKRQQGLAEFQEYPG